MRVAIVGDREASSIEDIAKAVEKSGFEITELICGDCRGADKLGEEWALENGISKNKIKHFPAKWDDLKAKDAVIKERTNPWSKKKEQYNSNAGFSRNSDMAEYLAKCKEGGGVIAIQTNGNTPGTQDMIKKCKSLKIKIFIYTGEEDRVFEYYF